MPRFSVPARRAQVFHLQQAGIACGYLSGSQEYEESRSVMHSLQADPPAIRILFVTPEKIARSNYLMRVLDSLHARHLLVRPASLPKPQPLPCFADPCWPIAFCHGIALPCWLHRGNDNVTIPSH